MALCEYARFVGGTCGSSRDYPGDHSSLTLENCQRGIKGHLSSLNVRDSNLKTEAQLLLARAGKETILFLLQVLG